MNFNTTETRLFEAHPELTEGLQAREIARVERSISTADLNRLKKSIQLGKLMKEVCDWYDSDETQTKFADFGISWSREDIAQKVFLCSKSQMFKNIKAFAFSQSDDSLLTTFNTHTNTMRRGGTKVSKSVEAFNKYANASQSMGAPLTYAMAEQLLTPTAEEITPESIREEITNTPPPSPTAEDDYISNRYEISIVSNDVRYNLKVSHEMQFNITDVDIRNNQAGAITPNTIDLHIGGIARLINENLDNIIIN